MSQFHIAQVNIARMRAPIDDPLLAGFVARLDDINKLADSSAGFVWRLQTETGNATAVQVYEDALILFNLSIWETPEQLKDFVYRSAHGEVMRERKTWFERMDSTYYALWWIAAGHTPSIDEAKQRLQHLQLHGETDYAFSFRRLFAAPSAIAAAPNHSGVDFGIQT
jgi:hypothetical protein